MPVAEEKTDKSRTDHERQCPKIAQHSEKMGIVHGSGSTNKLAKDVYSMRDV